jgi:hypothetical protein
VSGKTGADRMTNAEVVVALGERVWGQNWVAGMSQFAEINPRTLTRIFAAARDGQDYPAARGVIAALRERLTAVLADLEPWARRADEPTGGPETS